MLTIPITVAAVIILLPLLLSYLAYRKCFFSNRKNHSDLHKGLTGELSDMKKRRLELIDRMAAIPYENIYITSHDGKRLHAKYYHSRDGAPVAIQLHGYKSLSVRDFSGGAYECIQLGFNVILPDQRAHGESEGRTITFGVKERYDCLDWAEYAAEHFGKDVKILLFGLSMGAATVIMAAELALPENVVGVVADCPYSSPEAIIKKVCRDMKLPPAVVYPFIRLGAIIFGGFDPSSASAVSAAANTKLPIFLVHGEGDNFVPTSMSHEIAEAGSTVTLLTIPEATHGLSMLYDYDAYMTALNKFIEKILSERNSINENQ